MYKGEFSEEMDRILRRILAAFNTAKKESLKVEGSYLVALASDSRKGGTSKQTVIEFETKMFAFYEKLLQELHDASHDLAVKKQKCKDYIKEAERSTGLR